jgi:ribosome biogenesis GTPase
LNLRDLGLDSWFEEKAEELERGELAVPGLRIARVTAVDRGRYLVRGEEGEVPAEISGRLSFTAESAFALPAVGDWAAVQYHSSGTAAIIHALLPRRTFLRRKSAGKDVDFQVIAANVDVAFVVQSCDGDFNIRRLERYIVMANEGGIEPRLLLTKIDLLAPGDLERILSEVVRSGIAVPTIALSNLSGEGVDRLEEALLPGKTYCLLGSSGVGKTTILNRLVGSEAFATGPLRRIGKGKHTTARRQLVLLERGALLVDTPGMRELGVLAAGEGIAASFPDIALLASGCRFADCSHRSEPGCAVLEAVARGEVDEGRYQSYVKLEKEAAFHEMSYVERRAKDRTLGRFYRSVLKAKRPRPDRSSQ